MRLAFLSLVPLTLAFHTAGANESIGSGQLRITVHAEQGQVWVGLTSAAGKEVWADGPYLYSIELVEPAEAGTTNGKRAVPESRNGPTKRGLTDVRVRRQGSQLVITGKLTDTEVGVTHELRFRSDGSLARADRRAEDSAALPARRAGDSAALPAFEERITLRNEGRAVVEIADVAFGLQKSLATDTAARRWVAVPFRRQVDGKLHDCSQQDLIAGRFSNSDWRNDGCVADQELVDAGELEPAKAGTTNEESQPAKAGTTNGEGTPAKPAKAGTTNGQPAKAPALPVRKLRSEAWAWTDGRHGLLIAKYNPEAIEFSMASIERDRRAEASAALPARRAEASAALPTLKERFTLRFGGAGLALYRETRRATRIGPGEQVQFGVTRYTPFDGDWPKAYELYRSFLDERGHGFPADYNPPLNWNELFDVGWYHSNREQLFAHYTREALLAEAAKARELGCDLLYLDPGWEICEGTTLWDEQRLGTVADFSRELRQRFGLKLGYRTIGRVYREEFPKAWHLRRKGQVGEYERPPLSNPGAVEPVPLASADGRHNLALLPEAKARASSVISGFPDLHTVEHLNDGYYNNAASWVSAGEPSWVELDLGAVYSINEIALGSEHRPQYNDRAITRFEVRVATEYAGDVSSAGWRRVLSYDGKPIHRTQNFRFDPVPARWVRVLIQAAEGSSARIDELEVYEARPQTTGPAPVRRAPPKQPKGDPLGFWEVCTQCKEWQQEKLKRILAITGGGVDFMMFDEFDWRGPCYDPNHGHPVPSTPEGHVRAIYGLVEGMRQRYPQVLVEAHDPVWPWSARYLPVYFRQGFTQNHYQENWGFEFMWNPIEDLRSGRALCLYYYNLGCDIPLYDHITMEGDNDACLAFWWYASTVRHLGIGGKKGLNSAKENQSRYAAYKEAVAEYNRLRPFYARGKFIGLDETIHVHLHPTEPAAVVNVFNLSGAPARREVRLESAKLGLPKAAQVSVQGTASHSEGATLVLNFSLAPFSPGHVVIQKGRQKN